MAASIAAIAILGAAEPGAQTVRPVPRPATPASRAPTPERQLANDLGALTASDGVRRGLWGVIVYSLDRRQHLFDLLLDILFRNRHDASNDFKDTFLIGRLEGAK
jgi:hypothetical protein